LENQSSPKSSRVEEAGRKIGRTLGEFERRIQDELQQVIDYLDKEVVPTARDQSSRGLRTAAEKLTKLADMMDQQRREKP
jgi:Sec-independent protein translocase protein TatA